MYFSINLNPKNLTVFQHEFKVDHRIRKFLDTE